MEQYHGPAEYDEAINAVIANFHAMNHPRYKGYLKLSLRQAGGWKVISEETYCMDKDPNTHQKLFEIFCRLVEKGAAVFGKKDLVFEISNLRNDVIFHTRLNVAKKVMAVVSRLPAPSPMYAPAPSPTVEAPADVEPQIQLPPENPEPRPAPTVPAGVASPAPGIAAEEAPVTEPTSNGSVQPERKISKRKPRPKRPKVITVDDAALQTAVSYSLQTEDGSIPAKASVPVEAPVPAPDVATPPPNGVRIYDRWVMINCPSAVEAIDFQSMKYFPTEATPGNIRKVLETCDIHTNGDILKRLGTADPSRTDWEIFIKGLRTQAGRAGVKLWPSSDGTLYWWLCKKMGWIRPFPKQQ